MQRRLQGAAVLCIASPLMCHFHTKLRHRLAYCLLGISSKCARCSHLLQRVEPHGAPHVHCLGARPDNPPGHVAGPACTGGTPAQAPPTFSCKTQTRTSPEPAAARCAQPQDASKDTPGSVRTLLVPGSGIRDADCERPDRAPVTPEQPVAGQPLPGSCQLWAPSAAGSRAAAGFCQSQHGLATVLRYHHLQCLQQPGNGFLLCA